MTDTVTWLRQQLDEDERIATRAAEPEPWVELNRHPEPNWKAEFWSGPDRAAVVGDPGPGPEIVATLEGQDEDAAEARVEHIARHDPARVLREVAAKRKLIDAYRAAVEHYEKDDHDPAAGAVWAAMIDVMKVLVAVYADRPGFDPKWVASEPEPTVRLEPGWALRLNEGRKP